ncbi:XAC0095 family protein [Lysobacter sp. 2RAF19]
MRQKKRTKRPPAVYALPEKAHLELVELREHMRVMGRLAEPGTEASSGYDKLLRSHSFAWIFKRIGRDITRVLDSTYWSAEVQKRAR